MTAEAAKSTAAIGMCVKTGLATAVIISGPALGRREGHLKAIVAELGRAVGRPWGGEQKTATVVAWTMLAR
ncbi:MAG: hypothetical protein ACREQF_00620 [Candidatus Binataceae bacterium]